MTDAVAARDLAHRLAALFVPDSLTLLVRGELRLAAELHASRFGTFETVARPGADQLALKLGKGNTWRAEAGRHFPAPTLYHKGQLLAQVGLCAG